MTNKDILKQYVDSGIKIPEYQMNKLNEGLLKTYLRKRFIVFEMIDDTLRPYEFLSLTNEYKLKYIILAARRGSYSLYNFRSLFNDCPDEVKRGYINNLIESDSWLTDTEFDWCDEELKRKYVLHRISIAQNFNDIAFEWCDNKLKREYFDSRRKHGNFSNLDEWRENQMFN